MRIKSIFVSIILVAVLSQTCFSFDGYRRGFLLGIGAGLGSMNFTQELTAPGISPISASETHQPFITHFKIGGAPNNRLLIYYSNIVSWFSLENAMDESVTITAATGTVAISYYFLEYIPSWYVSGGIGISSWDAPFEEDSGDPWTGSGLFIGAGYEFRPYWSVEFGISQGDPSITEGSVEITSDFTTVFVTMNVLGY